MISDRNNWIISIQKYGEYCEWKASNGEETVYANSLEELFKKVEEEHEEDDY